jgi:hypothetical protein
MSKKRKKVDPTVRDLKRQPATNKDPKCAAPAATLNVRKAGPRHLVATYGPVTMDTLAERIPKNARRGN